MTSVLRGEQMYLKGREKWAYEWYRQRGEELREAASINGGKLPAHEWWRYAYYMHPYLLLESDDAIIERLVDVFGNSLDITAEGKIAPTPMMENEGRLSRIFTELIEETNWRGILTKDSIGRATEQVSSYFRDGTPPGVQMFRNKSEVLGQWLLKFSKREFVTEMYRYGRFRVSPASYYAKGSHIRAVKDLETARNYRLKAIREAIEGASSIKFRGDSVPITNGVVPVQFMMNDYYLFSSCKEISRRMPTDFDADSALVIKDKPAFVRRLREALLRLLPDWEFIEGEVYYFDPYNEIPKDPDQEFWKNIAYAYQKEHRCVLRPRTRQVNALQPLFVELGPLDEISEVITSP